MTTAPIALWAGLVAAGCASMSGPALAPGDRIPDVQARNQDGTIVRLAQYRGRPLVIYFYPKDRTAG